MAYPIPARLNLAIVAGWFLASVGFLKLASTGGLWACLGAMLGFSFVMQTGFSLLHEAEHDKLHPDPRLNQATGWLTAAMFPGSYAFMRAAHLAHHRNNRSDVELVDYVLPHQKRWLKTLQYYFLVCGGVWLGVPLLSLVLACLPDSWVEKPSGRLPGGALNYLRSIATAKPSKVRRELFAAGLLWAFLSWSLSLKLLPVLACYAAFAFSWSSQQYIYHIRTPRHLIEGAYNLKLWRPFEWLYLKFNYHLAHHHDVSIPWIWSDQLGEVPDRGYLKTWLALWAPPEPVEKAWPVQFQAKGPLRLVPLPHTTSDPDDPAPAS
jgi:fatty acid desaturase